LEAADAHPPADVGLDIVETYLSVHAVDGLDPGAYRWSPGGLEALDDAPAGATGSGHELRRLATSLCLDQPLGGTSGFTAFHCADLDGLLDAGGARAYRVAQLAGGLAAGRLQLGAFAAGSGATGLTFYDDQIRRAFATDAAPMLVSAVGTPAYSTSSGRRPDA
ncbi:MAG: hypothetical protein ACRDUY_01840, partial [Nitriliruptorales bacterium]